MAASEFEELDEAVAAVLGTPPPVPVHPTPAPAPAKSSSQPAAPSPVQAPVTPPPAPATPVVKQIKKSTPKKQPRRTGKVMDIHPAQPTPPPLRPTPPAMPPASAEAAVSPVRPAAPQQPTQPPVVSLSVPPRQTMLADSPASQLPRPSAPPRPVEPLVTPFLSDAKVEKRPLGAFSEPAAPTPPPEAAAATPIRPSTPTPVVATAQSEPTQSTPSPAPSPTPSPAPTPAVPQETSSSSFGSSAPHEDEQSGLPAELRQDVLSIESAMLRDVLDTTPEPAVEPVSQPTASSSESAEAEIPPVPSIVQQYKEKLSSNTAQPGAIFDTETYHRPIFQLPKTQNKRKLLIIAAIALAFLAVVGLIVYSILVSGSGQ